MLPRRSKTVAKPSWCIFQTSKPLFAVNDNEHAEARVIGHKWASDEHLLVFVQYPTSYRGVPIMASGTISVNVNTQTSAVLFKGELRKMPLQKTARVVSLGSDDNTVLMQLDLNLDGRLDVCEVDLRNGRHTRKHESGTEYTRFFGGNAAGQVQVRVDRRGTKQTVATRGSTKDSWHVLEQASGEIFSDTEVELVRVSDDGSVLYVLGSGQSDRRNLYSIDARSGA